MRNLRNVLGLLALLFCSTLLGGTEYQMEGFWVMPDGAAIVEIFQTDAEEWNIRIIALRDPYFTDADRNAHIGMIRTDINNPDAKQRNRSLKGVVIGRGFQYVDGTLTGGHIYDPGSGKTYRSELQLTDGGLIDVRGFVGISFLGKTMYWFPYSEYQERTEEMFHQVSTSYNQLPE